LIRFSLLVDEVKLGGDAGGCAHAIVLWCNFPLSRILAARSRYGNYGNYRSCFRFRVDLCVERIDQSRRQAPRALRSAMKRAISSALRFFVRFCVS
jgi:hypothetical protein